MQAHRIDENGIWTGESRILAPKAGWHRDEVRTDPPALAEGQFAQWRGHVWVVLDAYPFPLDQLKAEARAAMIAWASDFLSQFTSGTIASEPLSWGTKADAARAYTAGTASADQAMMIETEAAVTGETPLALCGKIIAQADLYTAVIAFATGLRRRVNAEIEAATDAAQLQPILDQAKADALAKAAELGIVAQEQT